ncbi:hypothetical protein PG997_011713 [Apiospora hydei]|uniref:Uncharacterized protein n=1 Tax=Apiospora hydei TaxID=1337664 RepID=A0ABR1V191_9PEZI
MASDRKMAQQRARLESEARQDVLDCSTDIPGEVWIGSAGRAAGRGRLRAKRMRIGKALPRRTANELASRKGAAEPVSNRHDLVVRTGQREETAVARGRLRHEGLRECRANSRVEAQYCILASYGLASWKLADTKSAQAGTWTHLRHLVSGETALVGRRSIRTLVCAGGGRGPKCLLQRRPRKGGTLADSLLPFSCSYSSSCSSPTKGNTDRQIVALLLQLFLPAPAVLLVRPRVSARLEVGEGRKSGEGGGLADVANPPVGLDEYGAQWRARRTMEFVNRGEPVGLSQATQSMLGRKRAQVAESWWHCMTIETAEAREVGSTGMTVTGVRKACCVGCWLFAGVGATGAGVGCRVRKWTVASNWVDARGGSASIEVFGSSRECMVRMEAVGVRPKIAPSPARAAARATPIEAPHTFTSSTAVQRIGAASHSPIANLAQVYNSIPD